MKLHYCLVPICLLVLLPACQDKGRTAAATSKKDMLKVVPALESPGPGRTVAPGSQGSKRLVPSGGKATEKPATVESGRAWRRRSALSVTWGMGPGQLGRSPAQESSPEGPMAFAVDATGRITILDQVNRRVVAYADRRPVATFELPRGNFDDLALLPGGLTLVLDRLTSRRLVAFDRRGKVTWQLGLKTRELPESAGITGIFFLSGGVWAEYDNKRLLRLADVRGGRLPAEGNLLGRPSADGTRTLLAARWRSDHVVLTVNSIAERRALFSKKLKFPDPVLAVRGLASAGNDSVWLAVATHRTDLRTHRTVREKLTAVQVSASGEELTRVPLTVPVGPQEQRRTFIVAPDGAPLHMVRTAAGIEIHRYSR